jgi:hypothetical protein
MLVSQFVRWGGVSMDSCTVPIGGCSSDATDHTNDLLKDANLLVSEHGEDADIVAAQRADSFFCVGDAISGTRWLNIFRFIARSHLRPA